MRSAKHWMDLAQCTLQGVRKAYLQALRTTDGGAPGFSCMGIDLRVDQLRNVILTPGIPDIWTKRDGRWCVSNETPRACLFMSSAIGATRFLPVEGFVSILTRLCAGEPWQPVSESELAMFLNLTVAEGCFHPNADIAIWVTVARALTLGNKEADIHSLLPELITDHDRLPCQSALPKVLFSEKLMPGTSNSFDGTFDQYAKKLFAEVLSQLPRTGTGQQAVEEQAIIREHDELQLKAYIREVVFSRIADELG